MIPVCRRIPRRSDGICRRGGFCPRSFWEPAHIGLIPLWACWEFQKGTRPTIHQAIALGSRGVSPTENAIANGISGSLSLGWKVHGLSTG